MVRMSVLDTRWQRARRRLGPVTRRLPYGHLVSAAGTYARLGLPLLPRPQQRFVIFAQGRSGSTLLTELLNSHPRIFCADEILTWHRRYPAVYAKACSVGHRADIYGFKVKLYQLTDAQRMDQPGDFLRRMHGEGWSVVHLHRRNVLRQALSAMIAERRDVYHLAVGASGPRPVRIDPDELLARTAQRVRFGDAERAALDGVPHLSLVYEDDLLRPERQQQTADRLFDWLRVETAPVAVRLRKIVGGPVSQVVDNHAEVVAAVAGTPYADLLGQD